MPILFFKLAWDIAAWEEMWQLFRLAYDDEEVAYEACERRAEEMVKEACDGYFGPIEADVPREWQEV
mgnify:CR=1 FL=1